MLRFRARAYATTSRKKSCFLKKSKKRKKNGKKRRLCNPKTETDPDRKPTFEQITEPDPDRCQKVKTKGTKWSHFSTLG
jgi:hypothetical protein